MCVLAAAPPSLGHFPICKYATVVFDARASLFFSVRIESCFLPPSFRVCAPLAGTAGGATEEGACGV